MSFVPHPRHQAVDDETTAYILETRKSFEDLRQVAAQLAGLLVLAAAGGESAAPDHPMLQAAERLHRETIDRIQRAHPTDRARPHHFHLLEACAALNTALAAARSCLPARGKDLDPVLVPLRAGYGELQLAAAELPGFEMISFEQGCCALDFTHGRSPCGSEAPR
jgi:hypothetical protein